MGLPGSQIECTLLSIYFLNTACPSKGSFIHCPILISIYTMIHLKSDNLKKYLSILPKRVMLIFGSPQCNACKQTIPQIKGQFGDKISLLYINGDQWEEIADDYDIKFYPTLIIVENGKEKKRIEKDHIEQLTKIIK